jgi:hypothetical protein
VTKRTTTNRPSYEPLVLDPFLESLAGLGVSLKLQDCAYWLGDHERVSEWVEAIYAFDTRRSSKCAARPDRGC